MCVFSDNRRYCRAVYRSDIREIENIQWRYCVVFDNAFGLVMGDCIFGINRVGMSRTICVASFDFVFPDFKNNISRKLEANFCSLVLLCCIANLVVLGNLLLLFQLIFSQVCNLL